MDGESEEEFASAPAIDAEAEKTAAMIKEQFNANCDCGGVKYISHEVVPFMGGPGLEILYEVDGKKHIVGVPTTYADGSDATGVAIVNAALGASDWARHHRRKQARVAQ